MRPAARPGQTPELYRPAPEEEFMADTLIAALLGAQPSALHADVSLATPLTLSRITGRDQVTAALRAYAEALAVTDAELRLAGGGLDGAVFTADVDGHTAQVLALATRDAAGLVTAIDLYGRPWPYLALVRGRLAGRHPELTDPSLGTTAYVPDGPGTGWIDAPPLPPLAADVSFYSPLLTAVATGRAVNERILQAAAQLYGEQKFRAVLQVAGRSAVAAVFDGMVEGNVLQLVAIFGLNPRGEIDEIRIFSRPWPVTAYFRAGMYKLLNDILGPEYWQGPSPTAPLPVR
jgi:hypothetical protein